MKAARFGELPIDAVVPYWTETRVGVYCYACAVPLAVVGWRKDGTRAVSAYLSTGLVRRPEPHASGIPRYGPPRAAGIYGARHVHTASRAYSWVQSRVAASFYVNCFRCDRGQVVTTPERFNAATIAGPLSAVLLSRRHTE